MALSGNQCAKLICRGPEEGTININNNIFTLGRGLTCNYVVKSKNASREHCRLELDNGRWYLVDSSTNGTLLNKELLKRTRSGPLRNGDEIVLVSPDFTFTFLGPLAPDLDDVSDSAMLEACERIIEDADRNIRIVNELMRSTSPTTRDLPTSSATMTKEPASVANLEQAAGGSPSSKRRKTENATSVTSNSLGAQNTILQSLNKNSETSGHSAEHLTEELTLGVGENAGSAVGLNGNLAHVDAVAGPSGEQASGIVPGNEAAASLPATDNVEESISIAQNEFQCSICTEMFIKAVTLNCSHSFCKHCITEWRKTKSICPICRANIQSVAPTIVLDNFIDKMMEAAGEDEKQRRREVVAERESLTTKTDQKIIDLSSDEDTNSESYDDDSYDSYESPTSPYYGGYGSCYICGQRGHWANGCTNRRGGRRW